MDDIEFARRCLLGGDKNLLNAWVSSSKVTGHTGKLLRDGDLIGRPISKDRRKADFQDIGTASSCEEAFPQKQAFSLAPFYLRAQEFSQVNLVDDFCQETGLDVDWTHYRFQNKIFEGCSDPAGDDSWGRVLFFMDTLPFSGFEVYVKTLKCKLPGGDIVSLEWQKIRVPDPVMVDRGKLGTPYEVYVLDVVVKDRVNYIGTKQNTPGLWLCSRKTGK